MNAQDELVFVLKCSINQDNDKVPRQVFYHIMDVYDKSSKGYRVGAMNHFLYDFESEKTAVDILNTNLSSVKSKSIPTDQTLFHNKDNSGFLYFRSTVFHNLILKDYSDYLPTEPYLIGYLIQKWEVPWAKLFPLRLYLRLGEQFECKSHIFINKLN